MIDIQTGPGTGNQTVRTIILTQYTYQIVSGLAIFVLFIFNVMGVKILFRLQSILFVSLVAAVVDFASGLFETHQDFGECFRIC